MQAISSRNLASEDSVIFKSVLDYKPSANEYTLLPKECKADNVEFTLGGVAITNKQDRIDMQRALTAGYRPKEGIKVVRLQSTGVDQQRVVVKSGMAVVVFTVLSLLAYTYVLDLSSLSVMHRHLVVLGPIGIGILGIFLAFLSTVPLNMNKEVVVKTTTVTSDVVLKFRKELFKLKRTYGSSEEQDYLFFLTACMDQAVKLEKWEKYEELLSHYEKKMFFYRDKLNKSRYSISTINHVGGVGYRN